MTPRPTSLPRLALAGLLAAAAAHASAQSVSITFDAGDPINGLAAGATLSNQYAAYGVTFAPNALSGANASIDGFGAWATNTDMSIVSSTGRNVGELYTPSLVSGNLLHSLSGWLLENGDASFKASFSSAVSSFSADFAGVTDFFDVHLYAYDGTTLVASATGPASTAGSQFTLSVAGSRITSVVVTPGNYNDWVGVDNLRYTFAQPVAAVPEPGTWALVAGGLGLVAAARRRRAAAARPRG